MAILKLNVFGFEEIGSKSISNIENNAIQTLYNISREFIGVSKKNGSQSHYGRDLYRNISRLSTSLEINTKDLSLRKRVDVEMSREKFNATHLSEIEPCIVEYKCSEETPETWTLFNKHIKDKEFDKIAKNIFDGEFPFITIYVARIGNKDYSFYEYSK